MGPNYLRFLAAVDETGTIREGGQAVGWSYRTCLNRIRRMEQALGRPVLLTKRGGSTGGSARLTPRPVAWCGFSSSGTGTWSDSASAPSAVRSRIP